MIIYNIIFFSILTLSLPTFYSLHKTKLSNVIYFAIKIGLFFIDRLCGVQKEKMQYHGMKAVYDEKG